MAKANQIVFGDTVYEMTPAYIAGAEAMRRNTPYGCNPHRASSTRQDDWNAGHTHEAAFEHFRFGKDLLFEKATGQSFEEDPNTPRDEFGNVNHRWGTHQAAALAEA